MRFATLIRFTEQGVQGIQQTTKRAEKFTKSIEKSGGEVTELLWLNGRYDGLLVYTALDAETAAAVMLKLSKTGNVTTETMQAFDVEEMNGVIEKI